MLSIIASAGVLGRGEYLKVKTASNWHSWSKVTVSSNSAAVSLGNPAMTSTPIESCRLAAFIHEIFSRYISRVYSRFMACSTREDPLSAGTGVHPHRQGGPT